MIGHLKRLGVLRRQSGLTQAEMAVRLNTAQSNVARLEKGSNDGNEAATFEQVTLWLEACGFPPAANLAYSGKIDGIKLLPVHRFLAVQDELARLTGAQTFAHYKPVVAIVPNTQDDHEYSVKLLRNLLNSEQKSFQGFLMPDKGLPLVFKHLSDRPGDKSEAAFQLEGALQKEMLPSPLDYLPVAGGGFLSGTMEVLEAGKAGRTGVVYAEHPLLRFVDIVQPALVRDEVESYYSLDLIAHADIVIFCCGATAQPSPAFLVSALLASSAGTILAHPTGVDAVRFVEMLGKIGREAPGRIIIDERNMMGRPSSETLAHLVSLVERLDGDNCARRIEALTTGEDLYWPRRERRVFVPQAGKLPPLAEMIVGRMQEARAEGGLGDLMVGAEALVALDKYYYAEINWNLPARMSALRSKNFAPDKIQAIRLKPPADQRKFAKIARHYWRPVCRMLDKPI